MTDDLTPEQRAAIEASIGSVQRIAMKIINLPREHRETGLEVVRRNFSDALKKHGYDNEHGRRWLDLQIEGIRCLIAEIEGSGGGHGGKA
jgi:hypothetical protein